MSNIATGQKATIKINGGEPIEGFLSWDMSESAATATSQALSGGGYNLQSSGVISQSGNVSFTTSMMPIKTGDIAEFEALSPDGEGGGEIVYGRVVFSGPNITIGPDRMVNESYTFTSCPAEMGDHLQFRDMTEDEAPTWVRKNPKSYLAPIANFVLLDDQPFCVSDFNIQFATQIITIDACGLYQVSAPGGNTVTISGTLVAWSQATVPEIGTCAKLSIKMSRCPTETGDGILLIDPILVTGRQFGPRTSNSMQTISISGLYSPAGCDCTMKQGVVIATDGTVWDGVSPEPEEPVE